MRIVLKQSVPKLGKEGQVVNVKPGYARNFLFPRRMAVPADKAQLEVVARRMSKLEGQMAETEAAAVKIKEKLDGKTVRYESKVGKETGKLFGAVTDQNIVDQIEKDLGVKLEKKSILLNHPLKRLGTHIVEIDVHHNVDIKVMVQVFDPEVEAAEAEAERLAKAQKGEAPDVVAAATEEPVAETAAEPEADEEPEATEADQPAAEAEPQDAE